MSAVLTELAKEFKAKGYPDAAKTLLAQVPIARKAGIPDDFGTMEGRMRELRESNSTLIGAVWEYNNNPNSETLTNFTQAFWTNAIVRVEGKEKIVVLKFPKTTEELEKMKNDGQMLVYIPLELTIYDIVRLFPDMSSHIIWDGPNTLIDEEGASGWLSIDNSAKPLYVGKNLDELKEALNSEGKQMLSLRHYMVFSQMRYVLTGEYPDKGIDQTRLGTSFRGKLDRIGTVCASSYSTGRLNLRVVDSFDTFAVGGRGEKVI
jgi:hypothetical protein